MRMPTTDLSESSIGILSNEWTLQVAMVIERYERVLKPMHLQHIEPTKRYADIIIPQGGHNSVAIEIMTNFISHKLKG